MRTTPDLDEDLPAVPAPLGAEACPMTLAGFEPFTAQAGSLTTNEQVDALRDEEGI